MFLRCTERKKDGKVHYYYSVVENRRVADHKVTQRTVLYLGEINQLQEAAWQDLLDRVDSECQGHTVKPFRQQRLVGPQPLRLEEVDAIQVKLSQMELRRPPAFGNCWLGCEIWRLLELDDFWRGRPKRSGRAVQCAECTAAATLAEFVSPHRTVHALGQGGVLGANDFLWRKVVADRLA